MKWENHPKFDTAAKRLAARARVAQGLFRGETQEAIREDLGVEFFVVPQIVEILTREWMDQEARTVDAWKTRILIELEDLKGEVYQRYAGKYEEGSGDMGSLVSSTEVTSTGAKSGTTLTEVRKPIGLALEDLKMIQSLLADQRKILGIDAPVQVRSINISLTADDIKAMSDEDLDAMITDLGGTKLLEDLTGPPKSQSVWDPKTWKQDED